MRIAVFLVLGLILAFLVFGLVVGAVAYRLMPGRSRRSWLFKSLAIGEVASEDRSNNCVACAACNPAAHSK